MSSTAHDGKWATKRQNVPPPHPSFSLRPIKSYWHGAGQVWGVSDHNSVSPPGSCDEWRSVWDERSGHHVIIVVLGQTPASRWASPPDSVTRPSLSSPPTGDIMDRWGSHDALHLSGSTVIRSWLSSVWRLPHQGADTGATPGGGDLLILSRSCSPWVNTITLCQIKTEISSTERFCLSLMFCWPISWNNMLSKYQKY